MNKNVSFELAKLLKEKGIEIVSINCYAEERHIDKNTGGDLFTGVFRLCTKSKFHKRYYSAPTISDVVMWLYEKHGIWIEVYYDNSMKEFYTVLNGEEYKFKVPTEAYESAIEHVLNNIK